jgi:prepilin-type N-terminal cleavage/methylation domain-containing protein
MAQRRGEAGFTMIELLVTLAVSAIGVAGMLALQLTTVRTNATSASSAEAVTIAERTIEEARGLTVDEMLVEYEAAGLPIDHDFGMQTVSGRTTTYLRRILVEENEDSDDLLRIRVEVIWADEGRDVNDPAHRHIVSLEILRTRQEAL